MIQNDAHAHGINTARQSVKTKYKVIKCFCIAHDCTKYWYHGTTAFLSKRSSRHSRSVSEEMRLYRTTVPSAERSVKNPGCDVKERHAGEISEILIVSAHCIAKGCSEISGPRTVSHLGFHMFFAKKMT